MVSGVNDLEPFARNVGINLGGGNVAVPEQHLDDAQIRAVIEKMSRKCMSQRVGRDVSRDPRAFGVALDEMPERLPSHRATTSGGK